MEQRVIRLLLIEDNSGDVDLIRECLASELEPSFEIESAGTLELGLERIKHGEFEVVLLDLALPDSFGLNTFDTVHAQVPGLPIVVMTVLNDMEVALTAVRKGAQDYLVKGENDSKVLSRVIRYSIERKQVEERQRFLARASVELSQSLDYETTLKNVAQLVTPKLADCCIVDLLGADQSIAQVAVAHVDKEKERHVKALFSHLSLEPTVEHGVELVLRTGKSEIFPVLTDVEWVSTALGSEYPQRLRHLKAESYMCVPLKAGDRVFGAITFLFAESSRRYTAADLCLAEDVAGRASLAVENARLYQSVQSALKSREDLLAFVSHDLRTPLTSINMNAGLIQKMAIKEEEAATVRARALSIEQSTMRMNHLIGTMLDLSRIEAGHMMVIKVKHAVGTILSESVEMLRPLAETKSIALRLENVVGEVDIFCDRERLMQVISNLLGNAIKFTPPKGEIILRAERSSNEVRFSVSDTGAGIQEENLAKIFTRYWQGKQASDSAGLGLFISRGIIDAHGGRLWVESEVGKGSQFIFTIPLVESVTSDSEAERKSS